MCTAVAFLVFFALIAEVGPTRSTVITYVNPAVAVLLGVTLLDEDFTVATAIGFVLILAGSVLATRRSPRRPRSPARAPTDRRSAWSPSPARLAERLDRPAATRRTCAGTAAW